MKAATFFNIEHGITAIIGGGGKTTLMYTLANELAEHGSVIVCTSAKIYRPDNCKIVDDNAESIAKALQNYGMVCAGTPAPGGKLSAPHTGFDELERLADYVIVEADGSKGLPLKAHAPYEPVIPQNSKKVINVLGADSFGKTIADVCHRAELFAKLAEANINDTVTPERIAKVLQKENLSDFIYINKVEDEGKINFAQKLAKLLNRRITAGSLHRREYICLY